MRVRPIASGATTREVRAVRPANLMVAISYRGPAVWWAAKQPLLTIISSFAPNRPVRLASCFNLPYYCWWACFRLTGALLRSRAQSFQSSNCGESDSTGEPREWVEGVTTHKGEMWSAIFAGWKRSVRLAKNSSPVDRPFDYGCDWRRGPGRRDAGSVGVPSGSVGRGGAKPHAAALYVPFFSRGPPPRFFSRRSEADVHETLTSRTPRQWFFHRRVRESFSGLLSRG